MALDTLLNEEIKTKFEDLSKLQLGSDAYGNAVDDLTRLVDRAIEIEKINAEYDDKHEAREIEKELKSQQQEDEQKDRKVRNGIAIAGIVIPTAVTIWGTLKTLKFEEVGTVTTNAGRAFMNRLFKK